MFFFIRRRRIGQIFSSFSAFFIVHFHILALAKIAERDTFGASPPPGPSLAPSPADSLGAPVAFPIFRPPMVSVHRQMDTTEKKRPMAKDHRLFPSLSLHNLSAVEEVSVTSAGGLSSSLASSVVEEEDDNLSQEEEELAFSPVQIFNPIKLDNGSSSNSMPPPKTFHRLGEFGTRQNGKEGIGRTTTISNLLPTHPSAALSTSKNSTQRFLPFENVAHSSITPQFPVFTGMGMEIIESGESEGERTTTSTAEESEKEKQWKALQHKMKYNLTTEAKGNSQKTLKIGESAKNRSTEETILKKGIATSANARNIYTPSIHIEPITKPTIGDILLENNATIGAIENSTKSIGTMATEDEVTEDLLAIFTANSEHSSKTTDGKKGDAFGQQIGDRSTQMTTKVPIMGPIEEIIPRPNISKIRGNEQKQQQSQSSHTERPTTTQQNISSSRRTTTAQSEPTTEATNTTPIQITENATLKTTQMTITTTTDVEPTSTSLKAITEQFGEREMHTEGIEGRITIGTKRKPSKTTVMGTTDNSEWLGGNHIEEGSEEAMSTTSQRGRMSTKAPPPTATTSTWSSTPRKSGGETNDAKENKKAHETSRTAATERTEGNVNFRLLAIAGIIAVLFIMVGLGSICTGRYVRKSRQLHGKYRPAAYELQTTRPPPLTSSSMTFAPSNRMANCNELQQNRHFEFGQIHQIPPPVHCPHQLTMNGNDCREERLI
ncbi:hypothetical protein niasHS_005895 [Heterodera schachtii]|uniref:Uncharacterized protein n=1 Tax=Heterodera schachtii TaxID=97005 RepID=A0ABD2JRY4_HETSC